MKRAALIAWMGLAGAGALVAQREDDPNEGARLWVDHVNQTAWLDWWGKQGRTYFVQQSADLNTPWTWATNIELGQAALKQWGYQVPGDRLFARLKFSDIPTTNPALADFDGDGIGNKAELEQQSDPLAWVDTDGDGLPDDWEQHYFGNLNQNGAGHSDNDNLTNAQEFAAGTDPTKTDTDSDGANDGTLRLSFEYDLTGRLNTAREGAAPSEGFGYDSGHNLEAGSGMSAGNP
jgi:hypothetical protein